MEKWLVRSEGSSDQYPSAFAFFDILHSDTVNELPTLVEMLSKRPIAAGQVVRMADIADIRRVRMPGIQFAKADKNRLRVQSGLEIWRVL